MHLFRHSMLAVILGGLAVSAQLVACGDEGSGVADLPDASNPGDGGTANTSTSDGGAASTPVLTISEARAKIYLGQTARIDGASVAPGISSDYTWKVVAAPFQSVIKTESLQNASTATPLLKPDLLGTYTLEVSGKKDGVSSSVIVLIEAIDAPVFWREARFSQTGGSMAMTGGLSTQVGGIYGALDRTVGCPEPLPDGGGEQAEVVLFSARLGGSAGDTWEAAPGQPSRVVFPSFSIDTTGQRFAFSLGVATSQSACGSPEAKVLEKLETDASVGPSLTDAVFNARFSPDGNRIAYLHTVNGTARLATIGFDGTGKRDLAPFISAGADAGGLDPDAGTILVGGPGGLPLGEVVPHWKDDTHVGWITFVGPTAGSSDRDAWELYLVEDKPGATAELAMTCSFSTPGSFAFLPDGTIVAAVRHAADGGAAPMNLLVYRANATTKQCEVVRSLTDNTADGSIARDVALSPDKTQLAFFSGSVLATVPVDGSSPAKPVAGAVIGVDPGIGPRWAAGGTAITWGQFKQFEGGGGIPTGVGHIVSIPASGGTQRSLAQGGADQRPDGDGGTTMEYRFAYGFGQGCSAMPGVMSNGAVLAGAVASLAAIVARRRRRSST